MRIEAAIKQEAARLIYRHESQGRFLYDEAVRRAKRTTAAIERPRLQRPRWWDVDRGFNPYVTRSQVDRIAHSIRNRLQTRSYAPRHPVEYEIPKASGGSRLISVYQVADGAISKMLFESLLKKNLSTLSARAYAYRKDVSAQDAIQYVKSSFQGAKRMFIAEYDFQSYFDSIDHEHIRRTLHNHFLATSVELAAIDGFLQVGPSDAAEYVGSGGRRREAGIPQGTSISLLLANVAAWDLDRALETAGVGFTRYADDTLIWSPDYARICAAAEIVHSHAEAIGVAVNSEKSPGIRLLAPDEERAEMKATKSVDYLGYELSLGQARMKVSAVERIRDHVQNLLYWSLLHEPSNGTQDLKRIATHLDRDYVAVLWRLRRYLYGDLSEKAIERYQRHDAPLRRFKGIMAAYPLIDDTQELVALDGWIASQVWLAVRKRTALLTAAGMSSLPPPHGLPLIELLRLRATSATTGKPIDLRVPSVRRVARVVTNAAMLHGAGAVGKKDPYGF